MMILTESEDSYDLNIEPNNIGVLDTVVWEIS